MFFEEKEKEGEELPLLRQKTKKNAKKKARACATSRMGQGSLWRGEGSGEAQRSRIRDTLFQRKVNEELEAWTQQLRAEAYVDERLNASGDE